MKKCTRRTFLSSSAAFAAVLLTAAPSHLHASVTQQLKAYKSPWCGCCSEWVDHMRAAGFAVSVTDIEDLEPVKSQLGIAPDLQSCHTALIDNYVIEGHVPAYDVRRLLAEKPNAIGLAVPGMPVGSPGMEQGARRDPFEVVLFSKNERQTFSKYQ